MSVAESRTDVSRSFLALHLIGCSLTWGCSFLFMKLIHGELSPVVIASVRALGAAVVLIAVIMALGQSIIPKGREWRDWLVLGTVNGWVPNILVAFALARMDSGPAALIQASGPLLTAVLGHIVLTTERLTAARAGGILIGFSGVILLIGSKAFDGGGTALGIAAMLAMTLCYAVGNIYARLIPKAEPLRLALGQQLSSAIFSTLLVFGLSGVAGYGGVAAHAAPLAALAIVSTALPIWIFMRLITRAGSTRAAMTGYLTPVTALIIGILVLEEPIVLRQIIGGMIVLLGVSITTGLIRLPLWKNA